MAAKSKAHEWIEQGATLVDVRSPAEFKMGALPNAINLPLDQIMSRCDTLGPPDTKIVLYCASGARSGAAMGLLRQRGFKNVINLGGLGDY